MPKIVNIIQINSKPFVELDWPPNKDEGSVSIYTEDEMESIRRHVREDENWECAQIADRYGDPELRDQILDRVKR